MATSKAQANERPGTATSESRRYPRKRVELVTSDLGYVTDMSTGGMKVSMRDHKDRDAPRPGQMMKISLGLLSADFTVTVRVVWVEKRPDKRVAAFDLGLEFVDLNPDVAAILDGIMDLAALVATDH